MAAARCLAFAVIVGCAGCHASGRDAQNGRPIIVFAASSLEGALELIAADFSRDTGRDVQLVFAGSQVLRTQIEHGAPADVFVSATPSHVVALEEAGRLRAPCTVVGRSPLVVAGTEPIELAALAGDSRRIALADTSVPLGHYTSALLDRATEHYGESFVEQLSSQVIARPLSARQVRALVELGEADAAILYEADVVRSGLVSTSLPEALAVEARYAAGPLASAGQRFVEHLSSPEVRELFEAAGITADHGACENPL